MNILKPLGFLGLLGIAVLILIYILKPNYQQKMVSSTYVWKLSLKYNKKRIPINRLKSLLILLCQMLIVTACALALTTPVISAEGVNGSNEKVAVIDACAGMRAGLNDETRFERAVEQVRELAEETLKKEDGMITVILAEENASFLVRRSGAEHRNDIFDQLDSLVEGENLQCSYGRSDIDGAMDLAQEVVDDNPEAEVILYTATEYIDKGQVTVVDVSEAGEWNAAILDASVSLVENYYIFTVDVASYGKDAQLNLYCDIYGANNDNRTINLSYENIPCSGDEEQEIVINPGDTAKVPVYSYERVRIRVEPLNRELDSFEYDNSFYLYGGRPETIRIQYASSVPNSFMSAILMTMRSTLGLRWKFDIQEVRLDDLAEPQEPEMSGFDVYIFEKKMPETLPTDGVVILIDPQTVPQGAGFVLGKEVEGDFQLSLGEKHPTTENVVAEEIHLSRYRQISLYDGYEPLLYCGEDPVWLLKDEEDSKIVVLPFSWKFSDTTVVFDFPVLFYRLFNYFVPSTLSDEEGSLKYLFDVGEAVTFNARGETLTVSGPGIDEEYEVLPQTLALSVPGTYNLKQTLVSGQEVTENFYVKIASSESNIYRVEDKLKSPVSVALSSSRDIDLLFYLAIALVAFLFIEWWLQTKEHF